jgi:hypothetical protein
MNGKPEKVTNLPWQSPILPLFCIHPPPFFIPPTAPFPIPHHSAFFILPSGLQDIGNLVDSVLYVAK